jgi:hypothetical protein
VSGQYYNEYYEYDIGLTFKDSNNNSVIPNQPVEYRIDGGSWVSTTANSPTIVISTTLTYYDDSACGGGTFAQTLDVKVGTLTILNYTAGR